MNQMEEALQELISEGIDINAIKQALLALKDCFVLSPKEFCEKYGCSKETQQYLERITKAKAEKEVMHYLHFNLN